MPDKLSKLRQIATRSAQARGHDIEWMVRTGSRQIGNCRKCEAYVQVTMAPLPNEIDIGGSAVALDCQDRDEPLDEDISLHKVLMAAFDGADGSFGSYEDLLVDVNKIEVALKEPLPWSEGDHLAEGTTVIIRFIGADWTNVVEMYVRNVEEDLYCADVMYAGQQEEFVAREGM